MLKHKQYKADGMGWVTAGTFPRKRRWRIESNRIGCYCIIVILIEAGPKATVRNVRRSKYYSEEREEDT